MAEYDVVIYWNHGPVPDSLKASFKRPTKFINLGTPQAGPSGHPSFSKDVMGRGWPHPLRNTLAARMGGDKALRIAVVGYSASVNGVTKFLASADGLAIDTALAIDGIACEKTTAPAVRGAYLGPYVAFGKIAAYGPRPQQAGGACNGGKCLLITNSQAQATTPKMETADACSAEIAEKVLGGMPVAQGLVPPSFTHDKRYHPWTNKAGTITWPNGTSTSFAEHTYQAPPDFKAYDRVGDFNVLRYAQIDPTSIGDHRYQGIVVLKQAIETFLADRWNTLAPTQGTCVVV
jgi:hypothetical protein